MTTFYKKTTGNFCCDFTVDQSDPRFDGIEDMLPEHAAKCMAEFAPSALPNRTYDAESIYGHPLNLSYTGQHKKALSIVASIPDSPMAVVPGSKRGSERYALRESIVRNADLPAQDF